jgi:hypothetical protein
VVKRKAWLLIGLLPLLLLQKREQCTFTVLESSVIFQSHPQKRGHLFFFVETHFGFFVLSRRQKE